jgi:MFS family permease
MVGFANPNISDLLFRNARREIAISVPKEIDMSASVTSDKGFYGWINVVTAAVMGVIGQLYIISFGYFLPFLVSDFGWSRGVTSLAATINMIVMGICGPFAGMFIVKCGARRAIIVGNALGFLGFFLLFFHSHLWELFLAFGVLVGLGAGIGQLLASTTVVNNWFVKKRSLALSIFFGTGGLGGMFLGPGIMKLIEVLGWRATFLVMSFMVLLFAIVLPAILIKNKPQDLGQVPDGPAGSIIPDKSPAARRKVGYKTAVDFTAKEAMRTRTLWLLIAYYCLNMLAMGALMTHQIAYLFDIGINATVAAFALSVMTGVMTFSQFGVGFLGMRFSMHSIAVSSEVIKIVGVGILLYTKSLPLVFVYMVVLGLGFGAVMIALMNMFPDYFGMSNYPKIMGFVRVFWAFIGAAGAPLAGYIRDTTGSYQPAFQAVIIIIAAGLICLIFAKPPVHPSLKQAQPVEAYSTVSQEGL